MEVVGHGRLRVGSGQGKQPVYLNLPVLQRLRRGRVVQREEAADREARMADTSFVHGVKKKQSWVQTDTFEKNTRLTVA